MKFQARGFATGAAISGLIVAGVALARGPDMNLPVFGVVPGAITPHGGAAGGSGGSHNPFKGLFSWPEPQVETPVRANYEDVPERRVAKPKRAYSGAPGSSGVVAAFGYGKPVCVRLCDGSFFPTASTSGGDAQCASQCPDAPTQLYTMATDRIEDATSSDGKPYSALPVAKRFETSFEGTCTCHRNATVATRAKEILNDTTLRKGDVVMTATGFRVFEGSGAGPSAPKDFLALSQAKVSKEQRATLAAMERANAGSPAPAAPAQVVTRPKGNVTVDNGPATP